MKKCFRCNWRLPLFLFSKDRMKYQRPYDQGRCKVCRLCNYKKWNQVREGWFFNFKKREFEKVIFESRWDVFKRVIK